MAKLKIDGVEYEVPDAIAPVVGKVVTDRDEAKSQVVAETARADAAEAKFAAAEAATATATAKADAAEAKNDAVDKDAMRVELKAEIAARSKLDASACEVLGKDFKVDGLSDRDVMVAALAKTSPKADMTGKSDEYVTAYFDSMTQAKGSKPAVKTFALDSAGDSPLIAAYRADAASRGGYELDK